MSNISDKKKYFLKRIGIDLNNLSPEFKQISKDMKGVLSYEEIIFLNREDTTGKFTKRFSLKDLVGTTHPDYKDKTWLAVFLNSKRGDSIVDLYMRNPDYYENLKELDQSGLNHSTPIELFESNGQFFIKGGNNRLSLLMMKYLSEQSKAKTDEEKNKIDEKYTYVAEVNPTPKDKDIMYMINMIIASNKNTNIKRTGKTEEECSYTIEVDGNVTQISSKEDLELYIRTSYNIENSKTSQDLEKNLSRLVHDFITYNACKYTNRIDILSKLYPGLQQFKEIFIKLRDLDIDEQLYEDLDINNIDFSELLKKSKSILDNLQQDQTQDMSITDNYGQPKETVPVSETKSSALKTAETAEEVVKKSKSTVEARKLTFMQLIRQKIAQFLQKEKLFMNISFVEKFVHKQLDLLPESEQSSNAINDLSKQGQEFENRITGNGRFRKLSVKRNSDSPKNGKKRCDIVKEEEK